MKPNQIPAALTKSIIQHKFYIDIPIEITHNISIFSPDFMVASFINERCFKTYNIVQYSPENDVLNPPYAVMGAAILDEWKS